MEEPIGTPTRVSHGVLLEQLAQLSGRRLSLTGRLKKVGQNGSTRFILRDLGIDIQGKGNEPSAKLGPLIRNYAELDVPDEIISNNRAGALVPVSGIVSSEDLATLHPNACLVLTGVNARRVSLAILKKASGMLRLVQKPTREIDTKGFHPRDFRQAFALGLLVDPDIRLVALSGIAGTGKTSLALLAGLRAIGKLPVGQHKEPTFSNKVEVPLSLEQSKIGSPQQSPVRILVCRSVHTIGKELGFLPGELDEKTLPFGEAVSDALEEIVGSSAETDLVQEGLLRITTVTYARGRTIRRIFFVLDDIQNMDKHEVHTLLTRAGQATKIVCTGDSGQVDNRTLTPNEDDGMTVLLSRMAGWERFGSVSLVNSYRSELAAEAALRFAD